LKPVAWAKKMPRFAPRSAYPSKLLIARITQSIRARKPGWFRTDSGTSYRLSKSEAPLSSRKAIPQPKEYAKRFLKCQQQIGDFHSLAQAVAERNAGVCFGKSAGTMGRKELRETLQPCAQH